MGGFPPRKRSASGAAATAVREAPDLAYWSLLLVTATLFLRPAEVIPALVGVPIYELLMIAALVSAGPAILSRLRWYRLRRDPVTVCALGMLVAVACSHATHLYLGGLVESTLLFAKTLAYYLLVVAVVDRPIRLRRFLLAVALCSTAMIALCMVDYAGWYDLAFIKHITDRDGVDLTGDVVRVARMRGTGIFQDPNDLAMLIVAAGVLCTYFLADRRAGWLRLFWLLPLGMLAVALFWTRSRGGLLALGGATFILVLCRFGRWPAVAVALLGVAGLTFIGGRQGEIDLESGTGYERILLWRDGFDALKSPEALFGIGQGMYTDLAGLVAHNSFVHAYVELGLFGGTLFFGCFFFPAWALWRIARSGRFPPRGELQRWLPYLTALLAGWCGGMMSLSRCYVVPTFLVVAVAGAFVNLTARMRRPPQPWIEWDGRHLRGLVLGSASMFLALFGFVLAWAH